MRIVGTGILALVFVACGAEDSSQQATAQQSVQETLVQTEDEELRELARGILPDLARRSGLELLEPVRIARRSRDQLVEYLRTKLDQDLPADRAESMTASYALLGLVPENLDLREILLTVYTEQVAGFYDPDSTALFVMEDQSPESLQTVLVHELVHAVQDQATNLDSLTAPTRGNDRQMAAQAAIEGHATVVMLEYLAEQVAGQPLDLTEIPDFTSQVRPALENLRGQYPALSGAPEVIQESLLFPYIEGAGFVQVLWQEEDGRPAPFGAHMPRSSEQVLTPLRLLGASPDPPTDVAFASADGADPVYENGLGEVEVRILLEELSGASVSGGPIGWDGDRYALFRDSDGAASLAWFSVWDSPEERDAFVEGARQGVSRLPRSGVLEAVEVDGRPGALLRIGEPPAVRISLEQE